MAGIKRDREGNEEAVLVLNARSADEALRARDVLAGIGVALDMPDAAVEVMFSSGQEFMEIRVPLERADEATVAIEAAFGADRIPTREDAAKGDGVPTVEEIEARARALDEEDERRRQEREARAAERVARGESATPPEEESWAPLISNIVYIIIGLAGLGAFAWRFIF